MESANLFTSGTMLCFAATEAEAKRVLVEAGGCAMFR